jgi:FMN hydrolase / 5-amino-6-(5-phospho-D-ribitylamino)uracil phosphatase
MAPRPLEPTPKAVLFDLDDTLCDYAAARETRLRRAFTLSHDDSIQSREAIDLDRMIAESIQMHPHGADHFEELFKRFGIADARRARVAANWYRENRFHGLRLFPGVETVFSLVRDAVSRHDPKAARPIGIVTNGPTEVQRAKLELLGVDRLVDFVLVSEEFGVAKPDPAIFREALRFAEVGPEEAIFVGDSVEFDMAGARAAGIPTVWVNRHQRPWTEPGPPPTCQIRTLVDLPKLLGVAA